MSRVMVQARTSVRDCAIVVVFVVQDNYWRLSLRFRTGREARGARGATREVGVVHRRMW